MAAALDTLATPTLYVAPLRTIAPKPGNVPSNAVRFGLVPPSARLQGTGQGKHATTILADQGDIVTVITDTPYTLRSQHLPGPIGKGCRTMHRSTLHIPTQSFSDYTTSHTANYGGSHYLSPAEQRQAFPSMHKSQISLGKDTQDWRTSYKYTFTNTDRQSASKQHNMALSNRLDMTEGAEVKCVMAPPDPMPCHGRYWSQYNRIHNKLGALMGTGVPRERATRQSYNPLNGVNQGNAWSAENRRMSGNRVLYNDYRKEANQYFALG